MNHDVKLCLSRYELAQVVSDVATETGENLNCQVGTDISTWTGANWQCYLDSIELALLFEHLETDATIDVKNVEIKIKKKT